MEVVRLRFNVEMTVFADRLNVRCGRRRRRQGDCIDFF